MDNKKLKNEWDKIIDTLNKGKLNKPKDGYMASGSKKGILQNMGFLLAEMQYF